MLAQVGQRGWGRGDQGRGLDSSLGGLATSAVRWFGHLSSHEQDPPLRRSHPHPLHGRVSSELISHLRHICRGPHCERLCWRVSLWG